MVGECERERRCGVEEMVGGQYARQPVARLCDLHNEGFHASLSAEVPTGACRGGVEGKEHERAQ